MESNIWYVPWNILNVVVVAISAWQSRFMLIVPIFFRVASMKLGQSHDCPGASEAPLQDVKYVDRDLHCLHSWLLHWPWWQTWKRDFILNTLSSELWTLWLYFSNNNNCHNRFPLFTVSIQSPITPALCWYPWLHHYHYIVDKVHSTAGHT